MEKEKRDNSFAVFTNKRKESEKHPDYTGTVMIEGKEYWMNMWQNQAQSSGDTYFSGSVKPKDASYEKPATAYVPPKAAPASSFADDLDDEIPF